MPIFTNLSIFCDGSCLFSLGSTFNKSYRYTRPMHIQLKTILIIRVGSGDVKIRGRHHMVISVSLFRTFAMHPKKIKAFIRNVAHKLSRGSFPVWLAVMASAFEVFITALPRKAGACRFHCWSRWPGTQELYFVRCTYICIVLIICHVQHYEFLCAIKRIWLWF